MHPLRRSALVILALVVCSALPIAAQRGPAEGEWTSYHGDPGATQYTAVDQIGADNFSKLEVAWRWASPDNAIAAENRRRMPSGWKSTPLMAGGYLYVNTSLGHVAALDAESGEEIWVFDTKAYEGGRPTNLGFNSRGVGYWTDGEIERIFQPSNDAMLWAIDAETGKPVEGFGDGGKVDLVATLRRDVNRRNYTVMSSPLVVRDVVIVGSSISDGPSRKEMPPGDVRAFDVRTGELRWTFHNPPVEGEKGYDTWEGGSAEYTGNANVWTNMSADPELGLVYLPFGTPTNDWYGGHRLGDNLFAESIVCVNAESGELVWHYQLVHHGLWDYDIPAAPTLFDTVVDGREVKGVAVVTKQAFTYVFDRVTGEPIWPIEERPVAPSDVPGERAAPTQPFPTRPPPFDLQGIGEDDLVDFSPELLAEAKEIAAKFKLGPIYTPPVVYSDEVQGTIQVPGWGGGANWWGAASDPETGMLYIPSMTMPIAVALRPPDRARSNFDYIRSFGHGAMMLQGPRGLPLTKPPYGRISAVDLKTGEMAWQVPHGDGPRQQVIDMGLEDPGPLGSPSGTGPLLLPSVLVFGQGAATSRVTGGFDDGGGEGVLRAFDKATGEVLAELPLDNAPSGTPMSYRVGDRQYIAYTWGQGPNAGLTALALP